MPCRQNLFAVTFQKEPRIELVKSLRLSFYQTISNALKTIFFFSKSIDLNCLLYFSYRIYGCMCDKWRKNSEKWRKKHVFKKTQQFKFKFFLLISATAESLQRTLFYTRRRHRKRLDGQSFFDNVVSLLFGISLSLLLKIFGTGLAAAAACSYVLLYAISSISNEAGRKTTSGIVRGGANREFTVNFTHFSNN